MKKLTLLLLAVAAVFFVSCNSGSKETNGDKTEVVESKEFQDKMSLRSKLETAYKDAKDCDEINKITKKIIADSHKRGMNNYADDEKMSKEEKEMIEKLDNDLKNLLEERKMELCK